MAHILLIEDDPRIREIVERGLGARGFVVTSAEDGAAGLEVASKLAVDLVLLDVMLPGMSGLEGLEEIRVVKPRLPVVLLTALDDTGSKVQGLDAGADDYLTKPFSLDELAARVRARTRARTRTKDAEAGAHRAGRPPAKLTRANPYADKGAPVRVRPLSRLGTGGEPYGVGTGCEIPMPPRVWAP